MSGVIQADTEMVRALAQQHLSNASDADQLHKVLQAKHEELKATLDPSLAASLDESFQAMTTAYTSLSSTHTQYASTLNQFATQADELKAAGQKGFGQIHAQ